jgi:hypothetical protein
MFSRTEPSNIIGLALVNDEVFMFNNIEWLTPRIHNIMNQTCIS